MNFKRIKTALPRKAVEYKPGVTMSTRWGRAVKEEASVMADHQPLPEYPRPQMMRPEWQNLNGWWDYAFAGEERPVHWDGKILVPFSPEAPLSGVERQLKPDEFLWYHRTIRAEGEPSGRWLLHFGAVDQQCKVFLNGKQIGRHSGGYLPFTIEMTGALRTGDNELELCVRDVSEKSYLTRGKQKLARGGMFYTAQSGIWQTVWMERVPEQYIKDVKITADGDAFRIDVLIEGAGSGHDEADAVDGDQKPEVSADLIESGKTLELTESCKATVRAGRADLRLAPAEVRRWTPDEPFLYRIRIRAGEDTVYTYGALREVSLLPAQESSAVESSEAALEGEAGCNRLCLNGEPIFMNGVLDQGYWPESLMTAPADEALIHDITEMKRLGFNMMRVHCKVEADRFYYHCDRLGMLVWQDMVNGGWNYNMPRLCYLPTFFPRLFGQKTDRTAWDRQRTGRTNVASRTLWIREAKATVRSLRNHPSVVLWVLFNEGWGQFDSVLNTEKIRKLDPTRLIDSASGWFDQGAGDVASVHNYFRKLEVVPDPGRAFAITEYGGFSLLAEGHAWNAEVYGYGQLEDPAQLRERYEETMAEIRALAAEGLAAAVYTQVSDIEDECNGLLSYDREVCKVEKEDNR